MTPAERLAREPEAFLADGIAAFEAGIVDARRIIDVPPDLDPIDWVERHVKLSHETTGSTQDWKLFGYQRGILQDMCDPEVEVLAIPKSTRTGITQLLMGAVAYYVGHRRSQAMIVQPVDLKAQEFVNDYLDPAFRDSKLLRKLIRRPKKGEPQDTWDAKRYSNGGSIRMGWASSDETFRGRTAEFLAGDEVDADAWEPTEGSQGDKFDLFADRGETRAGSRLIVFSSPTRRTTSRIWPLWELSDQQRYFVPCPEPSCGHMQWLKWGGRDCEYGIKPHFGNDGEFKGAVYVCEECHYPIPDDKEVRAWMDERGEWRVTAPGGKAKRRGLRGKHISALYSMAPKSSWTKLWDLWTAAQGNPDKLKAFFNTKMGEPWDDVVTDQRLDGDDFSKRAIPYAAEVPAWCLFVTINFDTQAGGSNPDAPDYKPPRHELQVIAWGPGEQSCVIGFYVLDEHPPFSPEAKRQLDGFITRKWVRADGLRMQAVLTTLDCGYMMDEATQFADERAKLCVAIRGENETGEKLAPLVMSALGEVQKTKRKFVRVGTRTAKNTLARRLRIEAPAPGHVSFPTGLIEAHPGYYKGLFAERRVRDRKGIERWERVSKTNTGEPWDTMLGNLVAIRLAQARYPKVERLLRAPDRFQVPEPYEGEDRSDMSVVWQERLLRQGTKGKSEQIMVPAAVRSVAPPPPPAPRPKRPPMIIRPRWG
ncbi:MULTISPECIES: terminase gpA endonuclease subunit [unclassified Methylobacterium]|uniref:terminase gpA endonuclease subunit n=2 Tax=Methylobacterium TaxID=407 RepID=UPI000CAAC841|nr:MULTISPECIES: terminase gpA endonuclease subunit [unclassified Methylobacterium]PIU06621.1 MAG: hypothetical protein COT56_08810 [Methylobacterium sp. CG09_land_8_20_14_0_10_71_15]PIU12113.1 MAG: hypothetical protein COT28_16930 [Methylobacterium sp. CG08_land_8_20_14_0_20_71_15]